ncbi:Rho termination protein, partial [Clostridium botulinum]
MVPNGLLQSESLGWTGISLDPQPKLRQGRSVASPMLMSKSPYPLEQMTLRQLRRVASEYGVSRYSRMRKSELIAAIQKIEANSAVHTSPSPSSDRQEEVEATKYDVGQPQPVEPIELTGVDAELPDLPEGYGESRIVLLPRDPQ